MASTWLSKARSMKACGDSPARRATRSTRDFKRRGNLRLVAVTLIVSGSQMILLGVLLDDVRAFFGDRDHCGVDVSGGHCGHYRSIHHAQSADALHSQPVVDHRSHAA